MMFVTVDLLAGVAYMTFVGLLTVIGRFEFLPVSSLFLFFFFFEAFFFVDS